MTVNAIESQLDSFDFDQRQKALIELEKNMQLSGNMTENVNMHFHSFFSFNSMGWSPSRIAWESKKAGLYAAGLCDFDVLDGQDEFLQAGELFGLRTTVNLETRAFLNEYADKEINSPGEPGVTYVMGAGFSKDLTDSSLSPENLSYYKQKATDRNKALIDRINPHVKEIAIDYESEVLPLTPKNGATERHIISAYVNKAFNVFKDKDALVEFWCTLLSSTPDTVKDLLEDVPSFEGIVRNALAKRGGVGYVQPSKETFPSVDDFIDWVLSYQAIPMTTWLDGTSSGEADGQAMLECMAAKGAIALNIIPDRNWNIADAQTKKIKQANLKDIIETADRMDLPINIGTEMNKLGQPFADDLTGECLSPFKDVFLKGAQIMVGHSILLRYADFSYTGENAKNMFDKDTKKKNAFFASVGALEPLTSVVANKLRQAGVEKAFDLISDSSKQGSWI